MSAEVGAFLGAWDARLHAIADAAPSNVGQFYAASTRLRGSGNTLRTRPGVAAYWELFFRQYRGELRFDWSRATEEREVVDGRRGSHRACAVVPGADPDVIHVRVPAWEDNPQSAVETVDGLRCTHIEGVYLLRLRRVGETFQICHDTWSLDEAICRSCPAARDCAGR